MIRVVLSCSLVGSLACAARPAKQTTAPQSAEDARLDADMRAWMQARRDEAASGLPAPGDGSAKNSPIAACGTRGSYVLIADHTCKDGTRPFDGDIPPAADSRAGNVGANADGHIIDVYEVPCPGGKEEVYVDMYDCDNARPTRSELEAQYYIHEVFLAGDFQRFVERCEKEAARGEDRVTLMLQACVPAVPVALRELGERDRSTRWLSRYCSGSPPPTAEQPRRWRYLASVLEAHELLRERQGRPSERPALTAEYAPLCKVDPVSFAGWLATEDDE